MMYGFRVVGVALALAAVAACGDSGQGTGPGGGGLTLESRSAVSARVGAVPDTLVATSAGGVRFSLSFDSASVIDTVTVRMTPVTAAASGALRDARLVAAVKMEPNGTVFARPAELVIELPAGADPSRLAGFLADGDGSAPHLVPMRVQGTKAILRVPHFSVAGVVQDASQLPAPPASAGSAAEEARLGAYINTVIANGGLPLTDSLLPIFEDWYRTVLRPLLVAAGGPTATDAFVVTALSEVDLWGGDLLFYGAGTSDHGASLTQQLAPELAELTQQLLPAALRAGIARADQACLAQPLTGPGINNALRAANNELFFALAEPRTVHGTVHPALQAVLDSLCLQVNYESVVFPQQLTVGQTVPFQAKVGMRLGGRPFTAGGLLDVGLSPVGAAVAAGQPSHGLTTAGGFFDTQLAIQQAAVFVQLTACVDASHGSYLTYFCGDTMVARSQGPGTAGLATGTIAGVLVEVDLAQSGTALSATVVASSHTVFFNQEGLNGSLTATLNGTALQNVTLVQSADPSAGQPLCHTAYVGAGATSQQGQVMQGTLTGTCNGVPQTVGFLWRLLGGAALVQGRYTCTTTCQSTGNVSDLVVAQFGGTLLVTVGDRLYRGTLAGASFAGVGVAPTCTAAAVSCTTDATRTVSATFAGGVMTGTETTPAFGTLAIAVTKIP